MFKTPRLTVSVILLIAAMGIVVAFNGKGQDLSKVKTAEEYWADTGISSQALEELLQDTSCKSSERYFLACANAVLTVAQKFSQNVTFSGEITPLEGPKSQMITEKEILGPWRIYFATQPESNKFSFLKVWKDLLKNHVKEHQQAYAVGAGMNGFLSVFKDPHTYLLPAALYKEVVAKSNHRTISIGVILGRDEKHYFIKKVIEKSSSFVAGLKKGDVLVQVNGQKADLLTPYEMSDLLRGEEGTSLRLTVLRNSENRDISILRSEKTLPSVTSQVLGGRRRVGVLTINKFAIETCVQTRKALQQLEMQEIRGLLLDLRDNPGGQMEEAACVASLFIGPHKKIYQIVPLSSVTDEQEETVYGSETQAYSGPMAVLINSGSASAAEIVAGVLQDYQRGALVGERTFGKGSFQEGEIWSKNSKIAIFETKGFYYLPSGRTPQMTGLEPDIKLDLKDRFALREEDQFVYPLLAEQKGTATSTMSLSLLPDLLGCMDYEGDLLPPEDPEMKEAHRVLSCRTSMVSGGSQ